MVEVQEGHQGLEFLFRFEDPDDSSAINISTATAPGAKTAVFVDPDGKRKTVELAFKNTGSDGLAKYVTPDKLFLRRVGTWGVQGHVIMGTEDWNTKAAQFEVKPNI